MKEKANTTNQQPTREELAKRMGISVPTKEMKTTNTKSTIKQVIQARMNEVVREMLCKEYPQYFYEIGNTIVQHRSIKTKEVVASEVNGYQLVIPKKDCCFGEDGKVEEGFQIGNFQIYLKGFQTQQTCYVIKNGQTKYFKDVVTKDNK
jgi:D-alanine-D-alanine ligase-like ATP-grasp enzyme